MKTLKLKFLVLKSVTKMNQQGNLYSKKTENTNPGALYVNLCNDPECAFVFTHTLILPSLTFIVKYSITKQREGMAVMFTLANA